MDNRSDFERQHGVPYDFSQITEVRLSAGKHGSPEEGMCFMEMTAWFAGEKHGDHPECACPVLTAYGITLNDNMSDAMRDRLLKPLVPLIAGTRGTPEDELARGKFLALWGINRHPEYWGLLRTEPLVAFIFHPSAASQRPEQIETMLRSAGTPYQKEQVHDFTVLYVDQRFGRLPL